MRSNLRYPVVFVLALLRGLGEFASLQRWRIREWTAR